MYARLQLADNAVRHLRTVALLWDFDLNHVIVFPTRKATGVHCLKVHGRGPGFALNACVP